VEEAEQVELLRQRQQIALELFNRKFRDETPENQFIALQQLVNVFTQEQLFMLQFAIDMTPVYDKKTPE
jgi:hypothetical protein